MEIRATTAEILKRMDAGLAHLQSYLATLSDVQATLPTDAAGWTVKDHLMHLVVWQDGIEALLRKQARHTAMGLSDELWDDGEIDEINGAMQQQHKDKSFAEVRRLFDESYKRLTATIAAMSDDELNLPYNHYETDSDTDRPVFGWIVGNTYEHYEEHLPWMQAISAKNNG